MTGSKRPMYQNAYAPIESPSSFSSSVDPTRTDGTFQDWLRSHLSEIYNRYSQNHGHSQKFTPHIVQSALKINTFSKWIWPSATYSSLFAWFMYRNSVNYQHKLDYIRWVLSEINDEINDASNIIFMIKLYIVSTKNSILEPSFKVPWHIHLESILASFPFIPLAIPDKANFS